MNFLMNPLTLLIKGINPPSNCTNLGSCILNKFTLANELFAKVLPSCKVCASVNNGSCGKLFSSLESIIAFDENFKVILVPFFPWFKFIKLLIR